MKIQEISHVHGHRARASSVLSPQSSVLSPQFNGGPSAVKAKKAGFSLVELSIVLVVLGLLTGGILTGQNLIRAAELRSVTTQYQAYQTAVMSFRERYFALPGDMTNATDFWDAAHATPSTCVATIGTGSQTCNGDGDGQIGRGGGSFNDEHNEMFRAWQHLANAGLIEGSFTGRSLSTTDNWFETGTNIPAGKISSSGWWMWYRNNPNGVSNQFAITNHILSFGVHQSNSQATLPILTAEEAWGIDKKSDDGIPAKGRIRALHTATGSPGCVTTDDAETAEYDLQQTSQACVVNFLF